MVSKVDRDKHQTEGEQIDVLGPSLNGFVTIIHEAREEEGGEGINTSVVILSFSSNIQYLIQGVIKW